MSPGACRLFQMVLGLGVAFHGYSLVAQTSQGLEPLLQVFVKVPRMPGKILLS